MNDVTVFATGEMVPASGLYSIQHLPHRLHSEVGLFKGEIFPRCSRCVEVVIFGLTRAFPGLDCGGPLQSRTPLRELPELADPAVAAVA